MQFQPYYAAFLRVGGGSNAEFIIWIDAMWREFYASSPSTLPRIARASEFEAWILDRTRVKDAA